jgi:TPR repeat protein
MYTIPTGYKNFFWTVFQSVIRRESFWIEFTGWRKIVFKKYLTFYLRRINEKKNNSSYSFADFKLTLIMFLNPILWFLINVCNSSGYELKIYDAEGRFALSAYLNPQIEDDEFWKQLGDENGSDECRHPGCKSLSLKRIVMCKRHQFEMVMGHPYKSPEVAEALNNATQAYDSGDFTKAMEWALKAVDQGVPEAERKVGYLYYEGQGVTQDYQEAFNWYLKAAQQCDADAENFIGYFYETGQGINQDYQQAIKWYLRSAGRGNTEAEFHMGRLYLNGNGVNQDYSQALNWFLKAAQKGNAKGQFYLGSMYHFGRGETQNFIKAMQWYQKSADMGNARAQNNLGWLYQNGSGVKLDYTKALEWYQKAVAQNNSNAQEAMGEFYENGWGVEKNDSIAMEWYQKAAAQGHKLAQKKLDEIKQRTTL